MILPFSVNHKALNKTKEDIQRGWRGSQPKVTNKQIK